MYNLGRVEYPLYVLIILMILRKKKRDSLGDATFSSTILKS